MNRTVKFFLLACAIVWGIFLKPSLGIAEQTNNAILGVDALMTAKEKPKGPIKIEGAVTKVQSDKNLIVLIDRKEFADCGNEAGSCALHKLPVQYKGTFPRVKDEVVFEGKITKKNGRFIFMGSSFKTYPARKVSN